jgi:hypothetical protein
MQAGLAPLEYMLARYAQRAIVSDLRQGHARSSRVFKRFEAAKAAAPYMHPRLAAVEVTGQDGGPIETIDAN